MRNIFTAGFLAISTAASAFASPQSQSPLQEPDNSNSNSKDTIDLNWYPPKSTAINDLEQVVDGEGVVGCIYDDSQTSDDGEHEYGRYNWANMPHVRRKEYVKPGKEFTLRYVEVIHRHHKRTPYAANTFPHESYPWDCSDAQLYRYGQPSNLPSAKTYWKRYTSEFNPFTASGFQGNCQFPQITAGGLLDSWQHGRDLWDVYGDFIGGKENMEVRVTNNGITSEVAGMVVKGMFGDDGEGFPLLVQNPTVDTLEPSYPCPRSTALYHSMQLSPLWYSHIQTLGPLFSALDSISGVNPYDIGFHSSVDHYYDNLSSRQAHGLPLPCRIEPDGEVGNVCVTQEMADAVYRMGHWEYSFLYRDHESSLEASVGSFGGWVGELVGNIKEVIGEREERGAGDEDGDLEGRGRGRKRYRHNIAHDGSIARLLSILQVDTMVWPGLGAEVVFEVYEKDMNVNEQEEDQNQKTANRKNREKWFLRVLWSGEVLKSSNPNLGVMDMVPLDEVLRYLDGLVGERGNRLRALCGV